MADSTDALSSPTATATKGTKREADLEDVSPTKLKALKASNGKNGEAPVVNNDDDSSNHKNGDEHYPDEEDDDDDDGAVGDREGADYDEEDGSDDDYEEDDDAENGEDDEGDSKASAGKSNSRKAAAGASADSGADESGDEEDDDEHDNVQREKIYFEVMMKNKGEEQEKDKDLVKTNANRKSKKNSGESSPNHFNEYKGTTKMKKNVDKETLTNVSKTAAPSPPEHQQSIMAQMPIKKRLSVQFYPVEHVQFISTRLEKK